MKRAFLILLFALIAGVAGVAQVSYQAAVPVTLATTYPLLSASGTAAVGSAGVLSLPAPPPTWYNYVCSLHFEASHDNSATTASTNAVTTSTNFNSFALKFSLNNVANQNYEYGPVQWGIANVGCVRSVSPGTATTFTSPTTANTAFSWDGTYYQAP